MQWGEERKAWDVAFRELVEGEPLMGFLHLVGALEMPPGQWLPAASDALAVAALASLARITGAAPVDRSSRRCAAGPAEAEAVRTLAESGPLSEEAAPVLRRILATDEPLCWTGGWGGIPRDRAFRRDVARALAHCAG
ncbi:hypothetical protein AB0M80_00630 [Amycolatopsis sp. NPDC051045]|uniref:hypothetical protein n=1 Tax=Amycolatopsis sp. NPDC051045 TaxID=3156922 RepID=UPI0034450F30